MRVIKFCESILPEGFMKKGAVPLVTLIKGFFLLTLTLLLISCSTVQVNWVTSVLDREEESVRDFVVEISNGKETLEPLHFFCSSHIFDGSDGDLYMWTSADGFGTAGYDKITHLSEIPSLTLAPEMTLTINDTIRFGDVRIYDSSAEIFETDTTWEGISDLPKGQYFIVFSIHNEVGEERYSEECLFVLYVE